MTNATRQAFILSNRRTRIAAFIIDHFVITFLMVSIIFLALGPGFIDENTTGRLSITMLAVMIPGFVLYFAKDSIKGVSIGKWIMGIMVRDTNDPKQVPSFVRLFARNLFIAIWPLEFIVLASNHDKKRLGDKAAKTMVVNNLNKPKRLTRILALVGVGIVFFLFMFLFVGSAMKNSDAYKVAVQEIEKNDEILNDSGGIKGYGMMPTGNVSISNGVGQAQLQIKVVGSKRDVIVNVFLTKEPNGKWKLIKLNR